MQKSCIVFAIEAKPLALYVPEEKSGVRYCTIMTISSSQKRRPTYCQTCDQFRQKKYECNKWPFFSFQVPLLARGDLSAFRELHPPPDRPQHHPAHAQLPRRPLGVPGHQVQLQHALHAPLYHRVHLQARLLRAKGE